MNGNQVFLLKLLKAELEGKKETPVAKGVSWDALLEEAKQHSVLSLLYEPLTRESWLSEGQKEQVGRISVQTVQQNYRLLFLCRYLVRVLSEAGIGVALLKGTGMASYYPVPELRKTGDVDLLLLKKEQLGQAVSVLKALGYETEEQQTSLHHVVVRNVEGIEVELHTMLAEPFDNERMNRYMDSVLPECAGKLVWRKTMGVRLPVLSAPYYAYELLIHMLQHFLRAGFGLKFLCDWVVFWRHGMDGSGKEKYAELVKASGIKGFSDMITLCCVRYLGLPKEKVSFMGLPRSYDTESFMTEIFEAGEFGKTSQNRMVALRGTHPFEFVREFHHQMHLNFPRTGKIFLAWPVLWGLTLRRFLRNNKKVRNTSTAAVLKEARRRGRLLKDLRLFR